VLAEVATHASAAAGRTFAPAAGGTVSLPVSLPLQEIVAGLNRTQPVNLVSYGSMLGLLAAEARAGRLTICPQRVSNAGEPLLPEIRERIVQAWHPVIINTYTASEGHVIAASCGVGTGMHLSDDTVIVEPVDEQGRHVCAGERASKMYLTNLFNVTLPLIRYELTDEIVITSEPCRCGCTHRRILDVQGRLDDILVYPSGVRVHPHVLRSVLGGDRRIVEYQVRQTAIGVDVVVVLTEAAELEPVRHDMQLALSRAGLREPCVRLSRVDSLYRASGSGKLRRFLPLERT
jgi:phenylacetate-coenzyme A ligase PaaK-like adenylate-forming protein